MILGILNLVTFLFIFDCRQVHVVTLLCLCTSLLCASLAGKRYSLLDGLAVLCMSIGLLLFNLADLSVQPNMDQTGECQCVSL